MASACRNMIPSHDMGLISAQIHDIDKCDRSETHKHELQFPQINANVPYLGRGSGH